MSSTAIRGGAWLDVPASQAAVWLGARVASEDVPHAWLLAGPRGCGKRAAARALASALSCSVEPRVGCGSCSVCRRIRRGTFPDVHTIAPEGTFIRVETVRDEVIAEAGRSPFEGRVKVFIVEAAERMNQSSQNAMLKTLEEPPAGTYFVLISDDDEELLDTVKSRCAVVRFRPLSEDEMIAALRAEGVSAPDAALWSRVASGDLERARRLIADAAEAERRRVWLGVPARLRTTADALDAAEELLSAVRGTVREFETVAAADVAAAIDSVGEQRGTAAIRNALTARFKREVRRVEAETLAGALQTLGTFYRDVVALRAGGREAIVNSDIEGDLSQWAASDVAAGSLLDVAARCAASQVALEKNANPTLVVEDVLTAIARSVGVPAGV